MYKLKVKVTKQVLRETSDCDSQNPRFLAQNCAVAEAMKPWFPQVYIGDNYISFGNEHRDNYLPKNRGVEIPQEMKEFIFLFDHSTESGREQMEPKEFEIPLPNYVIRNHLGGRENLGSLKKCSTLQVVIN